jgi:predicted O-linked N-acetylglucosamine transferase (SPINDLY family)
MRARLVRACEHFTDIAWDPDDVAARRIRDEGIDVLVDLKGYTLGARTGILARRPAPLQLHWVGYPGTMGTPFIDGVVADPVVVPPGAETHYTERVLRLPHCYQPNDRQRPVDAPRPRGEYGLPEAAVVFCCFNQAYKISPEIFAFWMRLLAAVPGSVLWLLEDNAAATANLRRAATAHGVDAARLVFAPRAPLAAHLARYAAADLALDTFPYGSHTTASDALWAGCPLVALAGETFAARVSGSIVAAAGFPELVTAGLAQYEALALQLATDPAGRAALRARLAAARTTAPLFDSPGFTRALEQLYADAAGTA